MAQRLKIMSDLAIWIYQEIPRRDVPWLKNRHYFVKHAFAMEHLKDTQFLWQKHPIFDVDVCLLKGTNGDCSIELSKSSQHTYHLFDIYMIYFVMFSFHAYVGIFDLFVIFQKSLEPCFFPDQNINDWIFTIRFLVKNPWRFLSTDRCLGCDSDLGILWSAL